MLCCSLTGTRNLTPYPILCISYTELSLTVLCVVACRKCDSRASFLLRQDEPGAIIYKKVAPDHEFFKGPVANFSGPGAIPKFKKCLF